MQYQENILGSFGNDDGNDKENITRKKTFGPL